MALDFFLLFDALPVAVMWQMFTDEELANIIKEMPLWAAACFVSMQWFYVNRFRLCKAGGRDQLAVTN